MRYRLGPFVLDTAGALWRSSKAVAIQPTPFKLLCYLVENHKRCVSNAELMEHIWGEDYVQETSLTQAVRKVRSALGKPWIENRSRVGYQYTGPLHPLGHEGILGDPRV